MAGKIQDIDRGWNAIKTNLKKGNGSFTKVGVQQGATHRNNKLGGTSDLVVIVAANEFGTRKIPSRPALRQAFDVNKKEMTSVTEMLYGRVLDRKISIKTGLGLLGEWMSDKMKLQITKLRKPPNAPATVERKGSSNPLIDTGQYRASISHVEVIK